MALRLTVLFISSVVYVQAQMLTPSVVASGGGFWAGSSGSIEWTLGEPIVETWQANYILTQGFHQAEKSNHEIMGLSIYPNPIEEFFFLEAKDLGEYKVEMIDMFGHVFFIANVEISFGRNIQKIEMPDVAQACYILKVTYLNSGKKKIKKIIKL